MPVSKKKVPQSRTGKSAKYKKNAFKFKWWMALILVLIVGGVGFIVFRQSFAGVPCSQAQRGQLCDNGPVPIKILENTNSYQCGIAQAKGPGDYRCGVFNGGQFNSAFRYEVGANNDDTTAIYKMKNSFNNTCGRISYQNPLNDLKNRRNTDYLSPNKVYYESKDAYLNAWWTSVGC